MSICPAAVPDSQKYTSIHRAQPRAELSQAERSEAQAERSEAPPREARWAAEGGQLGALPLGEGGGAKHSPPGQTDGIK